MKTNFGELFRSWRRERDLTLADVATKVGISIVHLSELERGAKNPPPEKTIRAWLMCLNKLDHLDEVLSLADRTRQSLKISLSGKSASVAEMAGTLARRIEDGCINDDTARQISNLLAKGEQGEPRTRCKPAKPRRD